MADIAFTYDDLTVVERWPTAQIETQHRLVVLSDKQTVSSTTFVEGDLRIRRAVVRDQLEAINEYEAHAAIARHEGTP